MVFVDDFLFHHYSPPGADQNFSSKTKIVILSAFIVFDQSQLCENYDFKK